MKQPETYQVVAEEVVASAVSWPRPQLNFRVCSHLLHHILMWLAGLRSFEFGLSREHQSVGGGGEPRGSALRDSRTAWKRSPHRL
ncbi:hypothetical protein PHLCEN_2v1377 [Hermanssonia centrifuga]|uniref:Uncharacterized protein n=1 Tax=Hermanssonia centrifuga TaxID=98765 RepID=A0A2R6S384_9APHY|nr:hypothetical protein PHLCEN_2v1377 [Hermanssonia centrifuga]